MSLSGNVDLLAARLATEFNTVRGEIPAVVILSQAEYDGLGSPDPETLYVVSDGVAGPYTATLNSSSATIDASQYDTANLTLTGAGTLNTPTGGKDHSSVQIVALASGGTRTLSFAAGFELLEGILASYDIPSGKKLRVSIRRSDLGSTAWIVEAAAVTQ